MEEAPENVRAHLPAARFNDMRQNDLCHGDPSQAKVHPTWSERLKQPSLSPESESAPAHTTMAPGWYISIT